jgi:hypothetical protein
MTHQANRLIDTVDEILLEAGQEQDTELRAALLSLGRLAALPAPAPNAQLAALLACRQDELSWRRRLRRHRPAIVGLAVVAGMGLGVTGVAASASRPAGHASASVQELLEDWAPPWNVSALPVAAAATGFLPVTADGEQWPSGRDTARQPARGPAASRTGPAGAGPHDAGPADRERRGPEHRGRAGGGQAAGDSTGHGPKIAAEPGAVLDGGQEAAREALEESATLLSGVVPANPAPANSMPATAAPRETGHRSAGKSGAGKKTDPGAKWLKKFNH